MEKLIKLLREAFPDNSNMIDEANELHLIVKDCVSKLKGIGFDIDDKERILFEVFEGDFVLASTELKSTGIKLKVNRLLLKRPLLPLLINNIYHEMCHYMQFKETIKANVLSLDPDSNKYILAGNDKLEFLMNMKKSKEYYNGPEHVHGHSACWWKYVKEVNDKILNEENDFKITATAPDDIYNRLCAANRDKVAYHVVCKNCGLDKKIFFLSEHTVDMLMNIFMGLHACPNCYMNDSIKIYKGMSHSEIKNNELDQQLRSTFDDLEKKQNNNKAQAKLDYEKEEKRLKKLGVTDCDLAALIHSLSLNHEDNYDDYDA